MEPNLDIDPEPLDRALALSGARTQEVAVTLALRDFIGRRQRAAIVESFGTLDWDAGYDHKADRRSHVVDPWSEPPDGRHEDAWIRPNVRYKPVQMLVRDPSRC